jgi:[acyl-carrier-protein] S-malonyltransferase
MGSFALVFPGQGSQYPGMVQDLYRNHQSVRDLFDEAGNLLGRDMATLCFEGPREALELTLNTQIAVLTADIAVWRVFTGRKAAAPLVMAGHSLGEYAALHAAGAVGLGDVLSLVHRRARYHQEAVPVGKGAMAAVIGLEREEVEAMCREFDGEDHVVALAGDNAPGQTVISGHATAVAEVIAAAAKSERAKAVRLPISVPCHCRLLRGAAERLEADLRQVDFRDCTVPVIPNCDPDLLHSRERTAGLLVRQIVSPVRWRETVERMVAMGVDTIVELGPKKTLTGLVKRIDRRLRFFNAEDEASLEKTLAALDG